MKSLAGLAFLLCSALPAGQTLAKEAAPAPTARISIASDLMEHVRYIEAHIQLPPEAGPLASYDRYYAFDAEIANSVAAYYVSRIEFPNLRARGESPAPGIYLVAYQDLPSVIDGHCATNISVGYTIDSHAISFACREHMPPPPNEPAQSITAAERQSLMSYIPYIETHIELPPKAGPLNSYERYYAVDPDFPRRIAAAYLSEGLYPDAVPGEIPERGIHLVAYDDLPWMTDGSCATNMTVFYTIGAQNVLVGCSGHTPPPPPWSKSPH